MKKLILVLLTCIMLCTLFVGCESNVTPPEKVVFRPSLEPDVKGSFTIVGDLSNFEALEAVIAEFKTFYPGVSIEYEKMDNYASTYALRLKNDPTVGCYLSRGDSNAIDLATYHYNTDAFGYIIEASKSDGHLYSVPIGINISGLVVNISLLQSLGLSVPSNYAEFTAVCDTLVEKGYTPIQQQNGGLCRYFFEPYVWSRIVEADNTEALIETMKSGETGSMEAMRPVFDLYQSFVDKKYIDPEKNATITNNYEAAILNFFEEDVAFMSASGDTVSGMKKRESKSAAFTENPFEYQFIYAPLAENGVYAEQQVWQALCASQYCEDPELVVEFLRFVGTTDSLNLLAQTKGIPSASALPDDARFANVNDAKGLYIYPWEHEIPYVAWNSVIGRLIEYASGSIDTIDAGLTLVEQDVHKALHE